MEIIKVVINESNYREHEFDHPVKKSSRHQIDMHVLNTDFEIDEDFPEDEDGKYWVSTLHFTAYDCSNNEQVYAFFIQALKDLAKYYEMESPRDPNQSGYNRYKDYSTWDYNECGLQHAGFPAFLDKYHPVALYGQSKKKLFEQLLSAQYLFYSSLKLISYPSHGGGVCNGEIAWRDLEEFDHFVNNPPPLVEQDPDSIY